jgi:hypothetical protein
MSHVDGFGTREIASAIRDRLGSDCDPVASSLGLDPGRPQMNRRWRCPSATCSEKVSPTLSTPKTGGWICHRCGEKGDTFALVGFALGLKLPLHGRDFIDVLSWLAPHAGVTMPEAPSRPSPLRTPVILAPKPAAPEPERPTPSAIAAAWDALKASQAADIAAARWLDSRGIPAHLTRSGFATLDRPTVSALADAPAAGWLAYNVGGAIVAPLRSMLAGKVAALQGRVFKVSDPTFKRRTIGKLRDPDGAPRVFGDAAKLSSARVVVLVEGMADTWAGEALTAGVDGAVVIGASNAEAMPDVAERVESVRVVVVRHLDDMENDGPGQKAADEAAAILGRRGSAFHWVNFRRAMLALGVDTRPTPPGFDLAAALELTHAAGVDFAAVQRAFLAAIGEAGKLPGLVAPKPSPLRVSAPPVPPARHPTEPVAPISQSPTRGPVDDVGEGRRIARTELAAVGWTDDETENLTATIDRLWGSQ